MARRPQSDDGPEVVPAAELPPLSFYADFARFEDFCRDCLVIVDKSGRRTPFLLNSTQRTILTEIRRLRALGVPPRLLILKARQVGISTLAEALLFWDCLVRPNRSALVIAHTMKSSKVLFRMSRNFHRFVPETMQQAKRIDNIHEIEFDSGSRVQVEVQGDPRGYTAQAVHLCFPGDTPILVGAGHEERADSVRVGDRVLTHTGKSARVRAISSRANDEPCVVVTPWLGRAITLTANHPVFTRRGWVPAGSLTPTDHVSMPVRPFGRSHEPGQFPAFTMKRGKLDRLGRQRARKGHGETIPPNFDLGYLCGYYLAEGCIVRQSGTGHPSAITFARDVDEGPYADRAWSFAEKFCTSRRQARHRDSRTVSDTFYGAAFAQMIAEQFGTVDGKRVSDWCWVAGADFCRGLLIGYLCGDGSKVQTKWESVTATSIRSGLAYQMRDLAASLGYGWAAVDFKPAGRRLGRNEQSAWTVRWHGAAARQLRELMGLPVSPKSRAWVEKAELLDGHAWMKIRTLSTRECPEVWDIEVDHPDHSFRTASFSIKNSEYAFYENPEDTLVAIMQTVPRTVDSMVAIESTANGVGNKFHKLWQRATGLALDEEVPEDEKGWTPIFIPWFAHEEYRIPIEADKPFKLTEEEHAFCWEHRESNIGFDQLRWRRWCISTNLDGDEERFAVEYPANPMEAFALSGRPAFDTKAVLYYTKAIAESVQKKTLPPHMEIESDPPGLGKIEIVEHERGRLRIFQPPKERCTYIVGADPSEGDPGSDHSPIAVLNQQTMDLDATWYGKAPPDVLACHAMDLARHYNEALIIGEANNHGILFNETLVQLGYPNIYYRKVSVESVANEVADKPGFMTTARTREHLFNTLRKYVRMRMGKLPCPHFVQQMQSLVYIKEKAQAQSGAEKDLLIAFALCLMAHRGTMANPLEPLPEAAVRAVVSDVLLLRERNPVAAEATAGIIGMTMDELLKISDALDARDARQKRFGLSR